MKANKIQQYICDVIHSQADFWKHSNDITSPTHLVDIEEECYAQLVNLINDDEVYSVQVAPLSVDADTVFVIALFDAFR